VADPRGAVADPGNSTVGPLVVLSGFRRTTAGHQEVEMGPRLRASCGDTGMGDTGLEPVTPACRAWGVRRNHAPPGHAGPRFRPRVRNACSGRHAQRARSRARGRSGSTPEGCRAVRPSPGRPPRGMIGASTAVVWQLSGASAERERRYRRARERIDLLQRNLARYGTVYNSLAAAADVRGIERRAR
jgi:hypothetical protein